MNLVGDEVPFLREAMGRFTWWARNLRIEDRHWRTRYPWQEIPIDDGDDVEAWHAAPTQGVIPYIPRLGQGVYYQGIGDDRLVESAGGELWQITPLGGSASICRVGGAKTTSRWGMAWLQQAENYVIRTDGSSSTMIWDGKSEAFFSSGFNRAFPLAAQIPNGAGPTLYHSSRLWVVEHDRLISPGDVLHKYDQIDPIDILSFEDQALDDSRVEIWPESGLGDVIAMHPQSGRDLEAILVHLTGGMGAIPVNFQRDQWPDQRMFYTRSRETSATGPYAIAVRDGGTLHRSELGIEDARIVEQDKSSIGLVRTNLARPLEPLLKADYVPDLVFASVINPVSWDRLISTVGPWTCGERRAHRGMVVANWNPAQVESPGNQFAWEGGISLPPEMGEVIQLITARMNGRQRVYALTWDGSQKHLLEWTRQDGLDLTADGSTIPQQWLLMSRKLIPASEYRPHEWRTAHLRFKQAVGKVDVQVLIRTNRQSWTCVKSESVTAADCQAGNGVIPLGELSQLVKQAEWIQIAIRGRGLTSIDLAFDPGGAGSANENPQDVSRCLTPEENCEVDFFKYEMP